jgi:hypothetical protein
MKLNLLGRGKKKLITVAFKMDDLTPSGYLT